MDERTQVVARMLHQIRGRGYCSRGQHDDRATYQCWDEARSILHALDGLGPTHYPDEVRTPTLAARVEAREKRAATNRRLVKQAKDKNL